MQITESKLAAAAEIAKSRTNDKRWLNAINAAVAGAPTWIIIELRDGLMVTSDSGETYRVKVARVGSSCACKSGVLGYACKHKASSSPERVRVTYSI